MEEKKQTKIKFKTAVILIIIGVIVLGVFSANVYASTNGYGNVFFLIKYLVTGEKAEVTEKDELLSDRDITISYEAITLTENLKIQIRNLQIKDNNAKLIVAVNENIKTDITPLAYKVYNEENKLICEQKSSKKDNETDCIEELILNEFKNNDKLLYLEILNSKNEKLNRIIINLETREVTVEGEKEAIQKISEIELKDFLSYISAYEDGPKGDSIKIYIAEMFLRKKGQESQYNKLDEVNNMLQSIGYKKIKDNLIDDEDVNIIVKNGEKYIELDNWGTFDTNTIIEIKNLKYSSGTYMANFTYTMLDNEEINLKGKMDNIDLKEATISFKMNEDKTYSIFKVVKFEKENSNKKIENNIKEEAIEKISENELKKYLSIIAGFEENFDVNDEDSRISLAIRINSIVNRNIVSNGLFDATEINNILKSLGYGEISTYNYKGEFFKEKVVNGKKCFEMTYEPDTVSMETIVGEIKDINYSSNIYTATFKYLNYSPKTNINYFDYKDDAEEATISFKMNEDKTYSIFKVVKFEKENLNKKQENNIEDVLIENNELIGSWGPSFAKENDKEISLRDIYGSGISGTMNFDSNGKYTAFIGIYSSENEDDMQGDYINGRSSITLIAKSGKKEILTIKIIDGIKYLEKQIGTTNQYVYFKKSNSNNIRNGNNVNY